MSVMIRAGAVVLAAVLATSAATVHSGAEGDEGALEPLEDSANEITDGGDAYKDFDELLVEVAEEVPQFGGFFFSDNEETLNIWLTGAPNAEADSIRSQRARSQLAQLFSDQVSGEERVKVLRATYTWRELHAWFGDLFLYLDAEGVVFIDIDDTTNRLLVGVEDLESNGAAVRAQATGLGVPPEALELTESGPLVDHHHPGSIRINHRPVVGGLQVQTTRGAALGTTAGLCTLGLVVDRGAELGSVPPLGTVILDEGQVRGFITASHCTTLVGAPNDNDVLGQPLLSDVEDHLGREERDAEWWADGCVPDRVCRYADVAFFDNAVGRAATQRGRVAWTTGNGSVQWDGTTTRRITASLSTEPAVGENVAKVGRTTGRSFGPVVQTCVVVNQNYEPPARAPGSVTGQVRWRCQSLADYHSMDGDSGAPVIKWMSGDALDATMQGIHKGQIEGSGYAVFAPMKNIRHSTELGPTLRVCAIGFPC